MERQTKEERKAYVKSQRKRLFENPTLFLKEEVVTPTITFWKEEPLRALGTFIFWVVVYYLAFGMVQAINNDMIYCDCSYDAFDGKLMYTYNSFVKYYNEKAQRLQNDPEFLENMQPDFSAPMFFDPTNTTQQEVIVDEFNLNYNMECNYDLDRWWDESILDRMKSVWFGYKKIILKQS